MRAMNAKTETVVMDRRNFLAGAAAAFLMPVTLTLSPRSAAAAPTGVGAYIRIGDDNSVTLITGQTEMGQGIATGLAQIMAEELMLDWSQVRFEHAPVNPAAYGLPGWGVQLTGGSTSTMMCTRRCGRPRPRQPTGFAPRRPSPLAARRTPGRSWWAAS